MIYAVVSGGIAQAEDVNQYRSLLRGGQWFDVKNGYGATGDGTTNDTSAVQSAIDAAEASGGVVYFPPGTYVAYGLTVTASNVALIGAGKGRSVLRNNANGEGIYVYGTSGAHLTNVQIRDLSIIANLGNGNQRCLYIDYADDSVVADCHLEGAGNNALNVYNSTNVRVTGNDVTSCKNFGVLVYTCESVEVIDNRIYDLTTLSPDGHFGIEVKDSQRCVVSGNRLSNIYGIAIYLFSSGDNPDGNHVVTGNVVRTTVSGGSQSPVGISVNTSDHNLIANNHVTPVSAGNGIALAVTTGTIVSGNRIQSSPAAGIGLASTATACQISGNVISDCVQGIVLTGCTRNSVTGNYIYNGASSASSLASAIRLTGAATYNEVINNRCYDLRGGSALQKRGILEEASSADWNIFALNRTVGNTVSNFGITGANSVDLNNYAT